MSILSSGTSNTTALVYTSDTTGNLVFQTNGTTEAMRITNNQQVCIGSSTPANPSTLLTVAGNITANSTAFTINGATPALAMYDSTWGYAAANGMYFQPGVNGGGTGLGNYFMANVPSGRGHTWAINNASAMRLESTGTLTLPYGQIAFPASQNASTDPNTLDDYEEGTWTPNFGGTTPTYSSQYGYYTKIGNTINAWFDVTVNSIGNGDGSVLKGLPFPNGVTIPSGGIITYYSGVNIAVYSMGCYIVGNVSYFYFVGNSSAAGVTGNNGSVFMVNGSRVVGMVTYRTT